MLQRVWRDEISDPSATAELRRLMGMQMFTHRLASDLRSDTIRVSGNTAGCSSSKKPSRLGNAILVACLASALSRVGEPAATS